MNDCPRCDRFHIFKRSMCSRCSFCLPSMLHATFNHRYKFDTGKYNVVVKTGHTIIRTMKIVYAMRYDGGIGNGIEVPATEVIIPKELSPKCNDADIEKYIALL
jgi:hypothetical protein